MLNSITTHRFNMYATILSPGDPVVDPIDIDKYGEWVERQDPLTGEIVRVWVPYDDPIDPTDPNDPAVIIKNQVPCLVRGIVDGGIRVAGTTERFGDTYENMEYLKMWIPPSVKITKRDRVTNIRWKRNQSIIYTDDEFDDNDPETAPKATVFNVNGISQLYDAFNRPVESFILLERAEVGV